MKGEPLLDIEPVATPNASTARPSVLVVLTIGLLALAAIGAIAVRTSNAHDDVPAAAAITPAETDPASSSPDTRPATAANPSATEPSAQLASTSAAAIELASLDGSRLEIPSGVPTVVYFMSTTGCVACEIGAFELQDLYAEGHRLDVIALEVIPNVPTEWMADYQQQLRLDYPVVADPDGAVGVHYDVAVLSMAIVVDAAGQMVAGPFDPADRTALDAAVATIDVLRTPPADDADTQPVQLLP